MKIHYHITCSRSSCIISARNWQLCQNPETPGFNMAYWVLKCSYISFIGPPCLPADPWPPSLMDHGLIPLGGVISRHQLIWKWGSVIFWSTLEKRVWIFEDIKLPENISYLFNWKIGIQEKFIGLWKVFWRSLRCAKFYFIVWKKDPSKCLKPTDP